MKCPNCNTVLAIADRQGIEIDYCPTCRGVWLERGELDKIIERSSDVRVQEPAGVASNVPYDRRGESSERQEQRSYGNGPHKKKRSSFLSELFEFGG